jgi:hypothetical protein
MLFAVVAPSAHTEQDSPDGYALATSKRDDEEAPRTNVTVAS